MISINIIVKDQLVGRCELFKKISNYKFEFPSRKVVPYSNDHQVFFFKLIPIMLLLPDVAMS